MIPPESGVKRISVQHYVPVPHTCSFIFFFSHFYSLLSHPCISDAWSCWSRPTWRSLPSHWSQLRSLLGPSYCCVSLCSAIHPPHSDILYTRHALYILPCSFRAAAWFHVHITCASVPPPEPVRHAPYITRPRLHALYCIAALHAYSAHGSPTPAHRKPTHRMHAHYQFHLALRNNERGT